MPDIDNLDDLSPEDLRYLMRSERKTAHALREMWEEKQAEDVRLREALDVANERLAQNGLEPIEVSNP